MVLSYDSATENFCVSLETESFYSVGAKFDMTRHCFKLTCQVPAHVNLLAQEPSPQGSERAEVVDRMKKYLTGLATTQKAVADGHAERLAARVGTKSGFQCRL